MKIRTQLILAFLLLSVVPMTGIVLYSYLASQRALRNAVKADSELLAHEMSARMTSIKEELGRGVERLGRLPFPSMLEEEKNTRTASAGKAPDPLLGRVLGAMGDAAPLVAAIEFHPALGHPAASTAPPAAPPAPPSAPGAPDKKVVIRMDRLMQGLAQARGMTPEARGEIERHVNEELHKSMAMAASAVRQAHRMAATRGGRAPGGHGTAGQEQGRTPDQQAETLDRQAEALDRMGEEAGRLADGAPLAGRGAEERKRQLHEQARLREERIRLAEESRRVAAEARRERDAALLLGRDFAAPVRVDGEVVGQLTCEVKSREVLRRVLARTRHDAGEVPFAVDSQGTLYTVEEADRARLAGLPLTGTAFPAAPAGQPPAAKGRDWVVVTSKDFESGLTFGIARPIGRSLQEVRHTAARNFGYGLGMIALALLGILPLSARMTRSLDTVMAGAQRIARGDLETRVPVTSGSELGHLALAFNSMAHDLRENQQRLVERELEQRLLQTEYDRKTAELEEARSFQLSLLPKVLPVHPSFELAVAMKTATEVGGDYYDFHLRAGGLLTVAVGDATGHGAVAGTMVTVIKSLVSSYTGEGSLNGFLGGTASAIRRMDLGRMAMALLLARLEPGALTVASAGMPPVLVYHRRSREVEEIALPGLPLGAPLIGRTEGSALYQERRVPVAPGDAILLMSDGFPELVNSAGEPLGYAQVRAAFAASAEKPPDALIADLSAVAEAWTGGQPPQDDVTFVALLVREA
ncbi:MAG TPA: SpoIIE family protein phosphatase [Thermoanaerobaculia bacterium]|nr:SpoIIE family protein phosphatase [Thermoanaerobaculia bacterium]